jgi:hypothetical protein
MSPPVLEQHTSSNCEICVLLQNMPRQINGGALVEFEFTTTSCLITFNIINAMLLIPFLSSNRHSFGLHPNELAVIDKRFLLRREKLFIVMEIDVLEWPPQSPDLSPIENLWNAIKMKMKALKPRPTSCFFISYRNNNDRNSRVYIWRKILKIFPKESLKMRLSFL